MRRFWWFVILGAVGVGFIILVGVLSSRDDETKSEAASALCGSLTTLEQGQLAIMIGGSTEAFERIKPVLLAIGPKVTRVGDNGQALQVKLAINLALVVQVIGFCEGVALAERAVVRALATLGERS